MRWRLAGNAEVHKRGRRRRQRERYICGESERERAGRRRF